MRQRPISSVPDWTLQTAPATFFRPDLESTLQPMNSSSRKKFPPDGGKSQPGADQAKSTTGLGRRTAPTRGTMQPFSGFSKCRLGRILLSHDCTETNLVLGARSASE